MKMPKSLSRSPLICVLVLFSLKPKRNHYQVPVPPVDSLTQIIISKYKKNKILNTFPRMINPQEPYVYVC